MLLHIGVGYQQNNFFDDAPTITYNSVTALGLTGATIARNDCPQLAGFPGAVQHYNPLHYRCGRHHEHGR
jgi:hypothetical protein